MLNSIDSYYAAMRARYNKSADELWCTPTNLDSVRGADWSGLAPYDGYFNGTVPVFIFSFLKHFGKVQY
jgi:hypothetical protein